MLQTLSELHTGILAMPLKGAVMAQDEVDKLLSKDYELGFTVDVEEDTAPPGLNEEVIRFISAKKDEPSWMTELRIKALHKWEKMEEPHWAHIHYDPIDYQAISYFSAPKKSAQQPRRSRSGDPQSLRQARHPP
jgi:hypothetical protein